MCISPDKHDFLGRAVEQVESHSCFLRLILLVATSTVLVSYCIFQQHEVVFCVGPLCVTNDLNLNGSLPIIVTHFFWSQVQVRQKYDAEEQGGLRVLRKAWRIL